MDLSGFCGHLICGVPKFLQFGCTVFCLLLQRLHFPLGFGQFPLECIILALVQLSFLERLIGTFGRLFQGVQLLGCGLCRLGQQTLLLRQQLGVARVQLQQPLHIPERLLGGRQLLIGAGQRLIQFGGIAADLNGDPPDAISCHWAPP